MQRAADVLDFVKTALECSLYLSPTDPGLTFDELLEIASRFNYQQGEVGDAVPGATSQGYVGDRRLLPRKNIQAGMFMFRQEPEHRNIAAFDFVCAELRDLTRSQGASNAQISHSVLVERAVAAKHPRRDVEAAILILRMADHIDEKDGIVRFAQGRSTYPLPSEQLAQHVRDHVVKRDMMAKVYPVAEDVLERRTDGRRAHAEPLDAFSEELEKLGYGSFRLWWKQTVAELRQLEPCTTPVAVAVLSAALVEGALTFVVKHARGLGLAVFASKDFDRDPRSWKVDDLLTSAAGGRDSAILGPPAKARADGLIKIRQRIHAGRMLSDFPSGPTDLRIEEARDARATAEVVVRAVLDWLERFPAPPPAD